MTGRALGTTAQRRPLYARLLRLRWLRLRPWQAALLGEGSGVVAVLLVLADLASAWALLVLPVVVALVVRAHDVVAGALARQTPTAPVRKDRRRRGGAED